jgi:hypothetical protein
LKNGAIVCVLYTEYFFTVYCTQSITSLSFIQIVLAFLYGESYACPTKPSCVVELDWGIRNLPLADAHWSKSIISINLEIPKEFLIWDGWSMKIDLVW